MKIIYVNCGEIDKYGSDLRSIEHYLSSSEIKPEKKSEYLHKVSDVYNNNYFLVRQCTILHFSNFAGVVWHDASHLVSW